MALPGATTAGSAYHAASSTPIRSSPLSKPPLYAPDRPTSPARPISLHAAAPHHVHSVHIHRHVSQPSSSSHRRLSFTPSHPSPLHPPSPHSPRSPQSPHPASPPLSRSQPLLGSYQLSLLHSRMSRTTSHSVQSTPQSGFSLHISAVGKGKSCPSYLRSPAPLHIPFSATYYDLPSIDGPKASGSTQTPWVGHVDVERRYFDEYALHDTPGAGPSTLPPVHPGMEIAPFGQLQILVKSTCAPVKVFIVPYDLRKVPPGGRLLIRERTVVQAENGDTRKRDYLRYAIQLQLSAVTHSSEPEDREGSATTRGRSVSHDCSQDRPVYFLTRSLKVIFAAQAPQSGESTRTERHDEVVHPSSSRREGQSGVNAEWSMLRQKWIARRDMQQAVESASPYPSLSGNTRQASPTRFEKSPIPHRAVLPHIPLLEPIQSADTSRGPSRTATPAQPDDAIKRSEPLLLNRLNTSGRGRKRRQGSSSIEDKELSEKLRALGMNRQ